MTPLRIAIDGSAASGKTTVARTVARRLDLMFLDTGAMYRALAWKALQDGLDLEDEAALGRLACSVALEVVPDRELPCGSRVFVERQDVTASLHTPAVSQAVPRVASVPAVRREMVRLQRLQASRHPVVMVGRDIGTVVLPEAEVKVFLSADLEERARRRWKELCGDGATACLDEVKQELAERDAMDTQRADSPLVCPQGALTIDSTHLAPDQVVDLIVEAVENRFGTLT